jgi:hypothetical protein
MPDPRTEAYDIDVLSELLTQFDGYYNLNIPDLANFLIDLELLEEGNRIGIQVFAKYVKWSFTVSFVEAINAWQWLLAGVLLSRQAQLPAQTIQMYYYSIFFSFRSFLSGHFKGRYTLKEQTRKDLWVDLPRDNDPRIVVRNPSSGGEHAHTATWFYEVFKAWDLKSNHPTVQSFETDQRFHSTLRNEFTYSLADIANELYSGGREHVDGISNDILLCFWRREDEMSELGEYFPEVGWAIEHIRVAMDLHQNLSARTSTSPYTFNQTRLVQSLLEHHQHTGLKRFVNEVMTPLLDDMQTRSRN